ncbi:MAG: hypothetical protein DHS20C13_03060 [Thermodesulfobacteriota bacterium]|nr:MAG: hypothetical protein DHS20C13_03060 [Thermodesulfobacteriota bacterium]
MANKIIITTFIAAFLIAGFLSISIPKDADAGIPIPPDGSQACCQWELEGELACSNLPQGVLCAIPGDADFIGIFDDQFCDVRTGQCGAFTSQVPTLSEWGLIAMAAVLGVVGFMVMRRKRATA